MGYQAYFNKLIIFEYILLISWQYKLRYTNKFKNILKK